MPWYYSMFMALGGAAVAWSVATKGIPQAVAAGFRWLLSHPQVKEAVVEHKDKIKEILAASEKAAEGEIDEASKPAPKP